MERRDLLKDAGIVGLFGSLSALFGGLVAQGSPLRKEEKLAKYAVLRNDLWIEAELPYGHYQIDVEDNVEERPGKFYKRVRITKVG